MATAAHLTFSPRTTGDGYDNDAIFTSTAPDAALYPVFSFTAVAGALYTVTSESWFDPYDLVLYDDDGIALAADDGWGPTGQDGLSFIAPYSGTYYVDASWAQAAAPRGGVELAILEDLDTVPLAIGHGTDNDDDITGTNANDALYGHGGWDLLEGKGGSDLLDGGSGIDTAWYEGNLADYDVAFAGHRLFVTDTVGLDGSDTLVNVERLDFADVALAFDVDGPAGQAYRLYGAALGRLPDEDGLGFHIAHLEAGMTLRQVAAGFVGSPEFRDLYGADPSYEAVVTALYRNVLGREPEPAGLAYWVDMLASGRDTLTGVVLGFSESKENHDLLVGVMEQGMAYQVWG
jgi:Ca2+-binding RTX toxin-like protein